MTLLPPAPRQIGIFDQFIAKESETLILREKVFSWTGDSFEIKKESGEPVIAVKGKHFSASGRKRVTDMQDNHLFDIRKKHFRWHTTYGVEAPNGDKLMAVKSKFAFFGSKAMATFKSSSGKDETLVMKGSWHQYSAEIRDQDTDAVVARIERKLSGKDMIFGQQTYALIVAPGVDMALMAALCICLDEKAEKK